MPIVLQATDLGIVCHFAKSHGLLANVLKVAYADLVTSFT